MSTHEHYEELCALAVTGQASDEELADLRSHLDLCPSCRGIAYDFSAISAQGLSAIAAKRLHSQIPEGMAQRFIARAHSEGIDISEGLARKQTSSSWRRSPVKLIAFGATAATIAMFAALIVLKPRLLKAPHEPARATTVAAAASIQAISPPDKRADSHTKEELVAAEKRLAEMINAHREELEASKNNMSALSSQLAEAEQQNSAFERLRVDQENRIKQLEEKLQNAASDKQADTVAIAAEENELHQLKRQVSDQAEALREQQALTAKGSDVRDLVVARNLHIIDVHDGDGNGKNQRTFGRIFYTEGKSLIFYAYDLADPHKINAKFSFHVWGERLGSEKPIKSLGVLHNDDRADGRWALTFDDPRVLAQIDSVFVTAEPAQKVAKEPRGERILFAFLGGKPNHP